MQGVEGKKGYISGSREFCLVSSCRPQGLYPLFPFFTAPPRTKKEPCRTHFVWPSTDGPDGIARRPRGRQRAACSLGVLCPSISFFRCFFPHSRSFSREGHERRASSDGEPCIRMAKCWLIVGEHFRRHGSCEGCSWPSGLLLLHKG